LQQNLVSSEAPSVLDGALKIVHTVKLAHSVGYDKSFIEHAFFLLKVKVIQGDDLIIPLLAP